MSLLFAIAAGVVGAILAALGILVAFRPPKTIGRQRALGAGVALLAFIAIGSEIHNRLAEARKEAETTRRLAELTAAAALAREDAATTLASNQKLTRSNEALTAEIEILKNKPGVMEVERERALHAQISAFLERVDHFFAERHAEMSKDPNPDHQLPLQQATASIYIATYCPEAAELLKSAVALQVEGASLLTCDQQQALDGKSPGYKKLKALQRNLPK